MTPGSKERASRRRMLLQLAAMSPVVYPARAWLQPAPRPKVGALFSGVVMDGGFMEAGYRGLVRSRDELGIEFRYVDGIKPQRDALTEALREIARQSPDLVLAHGGQNNDAAKVVAAEFEKISFVVTQGNVTGPNLASYEVLQEDSAWLAGALAGMTTTTNVIGHMSGIRVTPGLKGRAAFAAGLAHTNPQARFVTNFSGNQDDVVLARRIALAEIDAGADIIFSMLNAGRIGAIEACRERKVRHIANVRDWYGDAPDVILASAVADTSFAVFDAIRDFRNGKLKVGQIHHIGLEQPSAVRLAIAPNVSANTMVAIDRLTAGIRSGEIKVSTSFTGEEFAAS